MICVKTPFVSARPSIRPKTRTWTHIRPVYVPSRVQVHVASKGESSSPEPTIEMQVNSIMKRAKTAQQKYSTYTQEQVDHIFEAVSMAAISNRIMLAELAVAETGMGVVEDKIFKNQFAAEIVHDRYRSEKTCGIIETDTENGITKIAEPVGVIVALIPATNPTSSVIFKALLALKTRNALVIYPSRRATGCTIEAAKVVLKAAVDAGAPEDIITWATGNSQDVAKLLMGSSDTDLIIATGGPSMVRAAYSSGRPAIGVGSGNTPAVIDRTADIGEAVSSILISKTFDNSTTCPAEQSVVVEDAVYDKVITEFVRRGAYILTPTDLVKVRSKMMAFGGLNPAIAGKSVARLAQIFDITENVPAGTKVLIGQVTEVGHSEPMSMEKPCPLLAMYRVDNFAAATELAARLVDFAGKGHTAVLHTDTNNRKHIEAFGNALKTSRLVINSPAAQGAMGGIYNFALNPATTLGCGSWGSTSMTANLSVNHMLNVKTVIERREDVLKFRVPPRVYMKSGCLETALLEMVTTIEGFGECQKRAMIVTDKFLTDMGVAAMITNIMDKAGIVHYVFNSVPPDPTLSCVNEGVAAMKEFKPDIVIAIGGGSPMDAAKAMRLMYLVPDVRFDTLTTHFMDIRRKTYAIVPPAGPSSLMKLVCIPTTSGTGSEMSPFSVITDTTANRKYPLADYFLIPDAAILDPLLVANLPKGLTALGGIDALSHAIESYVSVSATQFTKTLSTRAISQLFEYLPRAYKDGAQDPVAREHVHSAAGLAGAAFANASVGLCHSIAHQLGAEYHIPHGLAIAVALTQVISYNSTDRPERQTVFSQYVTPRAKHDYAKIADLLRLSNTSIDTGYATDSNDTISFYNTDANLTTSTIDWDQIHGFNNTDDDKVMLLLEAIDRLKAQLDIDTCLSSILGKKGITVEVYRKNVPRLARAAYDDLSTNTNPRSPMIKDIERIMHSIW